MNAWQQGILFPTLVRLVNIALIFQARVRIPTIRVDATAWLDDVAYKRQQMLGRSAGDPAHTNTANAVAILLCRNDYQGLLGLRAGTTAAAFFPATNVRLVHFDSPLKAIPPRPDHGSPKFMQPRPSRFITAQPQQSLESQGAWRRFSGWSTTRRLETMWSVACGCPGKSFRRSRRSDSHKRSIEKGSP